MVLDAHQANFAQTVAATVVRFMRWRYSSAVALSGAAGLAVLERLCAAMD